MTKNKNAKNNKHYPFVSVCTPTFNRRPFLPIMFECFRNQDYPKSRMEWIIVDDGTDKIEDLVNAADIPQIKYFYLPEKLSLGAKRNFMHKQTKGSILVYMDDDDYYPPERVSHAVEKLTENKQALCAGSSEIYIYFKHIQKMYQAGPYGPNHATAGTFAFRRELLDQSHYEDTAALAEEKAFLKNYTIPFVQLDPMKCILVFSHNQNTFDKKKLLENPHPQYFKESNKTVDMFIRFNDEAKIKKFFMKEIDPLLAKYAPGDPKMKPDVLAQIKVIETEREELIKKMQAEQQSQFPQIVLQNPGEPPRVLTPQEVVGLIQQQQQQLQQLPTLIQKMNELEKMASQMPALIARNTELERMVVQLQKQLLEAKLESKPAATEKKVRFGPELPPTPSSSGTSSAKPIILGMPPSMMLPIVPPVPAPAPVPPPKPLSKSDPEVYVDINI